MEIKIQSVHFDATSQLQSFIENKVSKLEKYCDEIISAEVVLRVVKPETALNKEASIKILVPKADDIYSQKIADSFEEAIDNVVDALTKQLQKKKENRRIMILSISYSSTTPMPTRIFDSHTRTITTRLI